METIQIVTTAATIPVGSRGHAYLEPKENYRNVMLKENKQQLKIFQTAKCNLSVRAYIGCIKYLFK